MATFELNERNLKAASVGDVLRDAKISGLHVRCFPERKSFYLYFRVKGTKQERKPKLGDWGSITLDQARKAAQEMLAEVAAGRDPQATREAAFTEPTLTDLWDLYWKEYGSKKKSSKDDRQLWETKLAPTLGKLRLSAISPKAVYELFKKITDGDAASQVKPAPIRANRTISLLSKMFNFGAQPEHGIVSTNPCKGLKKNPENKRKRYMKGEEAARIAELLMKESEAHPASVAFIYLLILTGARKGEIADAKWDMIEDNKIVREKHKLERYGDDRVIHLPQPALDVLSKLPRTNGTITGIQSPQKIWLRIRKEAGCPDLRLHDLRHSFASAAIGAGLTLAEIGELLGHKSTQTTHRYAHLVEEAAQSAAARTADKIMARMGQKPAVKQA